MPSKGSCFCFFHIGEDALHLFEGGGLTRCGDCQTRDVTDCYSLWKFLEEQTFEEQTFCHRGYSLVLVLSQLDESLMNSRREIKGRTHVCIILLHHMMMYLRDEGGHMLSSNGHI